MQNILKLLLVFGLVGFVAACGQQEEEILIDDTTITVDPPMGKYK